MDQDRETAQPLSPLIFGEVLYDCFAHGGVVPGGAPFNVAGHLQGFGLGPLFVGRDGADQLGERMLSAMDQWGSDWRGVQRDRRYPTGRVMANIRDREPHFEISADQACDFIERHAAARAALDQGRAADLPLLVDVNLRDPWWRGGWLHEALARAGANSTSMNCGCWGRRRVRHWRISPPALRPCAVPADGRCGW